MISDYVCDQRGCQGVFTTRLFTRDKENWKVWIRFHMKNYDSFLNSELVPCYKWISLDFFSFIPDKNQDLTKDLVPGPNGPVPKRPVGYLEFLLKIKKITLI